MQEKSSAREGKPVSGSVGKILAEMYRGGPVTGASLAKHPSSLLNNDEILAYLLTLDFSRPVSRQLNSLPISEQQKGEISLAAQVLWEFYSQSHFHPELGYFLLQQSASLIAATLSEDGWLYKKNHPAGKLLSKISSIAMGWYPAHPQAKTVIENIEIWFAKLAATGSLDEVNEDLDEWYSTFKAKNNRLKSRVKEAQIGTSKTVNAKMNSARTINRIVAGRELPEFLTADLNDVWHSALQWAELNAGVGSTLWRETVKSLGLLVWSVQPEAANPKFKEKYLRVISLLNQDLPTLLDTLIGDKAKVEKHIEQIERVEYCQSTEKEVEYSPVVVLEEGDGAVTDAGKKLINDIDNLSISEWFEIVETAERIQVLFKRQDNQQLLFVNQAGIQTLTCSYVDFAQKFSRGEIQRVERCMDLEDLVIQQWNDLTFEYKEKKAKERDSQLAGLEKKQHQHEIDAVRRREAIAMAAKQEKINKQILKASEEKKLKETARREKKANVYGKSKSEIRQKVRLMISGVSLDTCFIFYDDEGVKVKCRLSVVLPSSGKFLFVDDDGKTCFEFLRNDLVDEIIKGAVEPVINDEAFSGILNRLIKNTKKSMA